MAKIASRISMMPETRKNLISIQRSFKNGNGLIADGRDMGTVVFPEAAYKIFLTADPETRAKRRFLELQKKGQEVNMRDLIKDIEARDKADTERSLSPLIPASDASIIDTSILNPDQVLSRAIELVC